MQIEHRHWIAGRKKQYKTLLKDNGILKPGEKIRWRKEVVYIAFIERNGEIIELSKFYEWGK